MSRVGSVVHDGRAEAVEAAASIASALHDLGVDVIERADGSIPCDLIVALGGDGTFLRAARVASSVDAPVLGVKVGRLGFLTEVEPSEAVEVITEALAGRAPIEERLALVAEPDRGAAFTGEWALNEIMVEKGTRHRLVRLRLEVDGSYVTTFSADGVIVATPTGSTAYSFSARGPIVSPDIDCMIVTPIAAHMVFDRSLVLGSGQVVTLEVVGDEPGLVSADGRPSTELPVGTGVTIRRADRPARFVRRPDAIPFLSRVHDKFGLPTDDAG